MYVNVFHAKEKPVTQTDFLVFFVAGPLMASWVQRVQRLVIVYAIEVCTTLANNLLDLIQKRLLKIYCSPCIFLNCQPLSFEFRDDDNCYGRSLCWVDETTFREAAGFGRL